MIDNTVFIKNYRKNEIIDASDSEIWRYAGIPIGKSEIDGELKKTFQEVKSEIQNTFAYKVCYRRMNLLWENEGPLLPFSAKSSALSKLLEKSNEIIIFSATVGLEIDRYIARHQHISPVKALLANAYGAERIENLCDTFCEDIKNELSGEGLSVTRRFSPGYGDFPLESQKEMFALLDCNRKIGVSLSDSLLMSPSKSVTAIIGIKQGKCENRSEHICADCGKADCTFRKQEK